MHGAPTPQSHLTHVPTPPVIKRGPARCSPIRSLPVADQTAADEFRELLRRDLQAAIKAVRRDEVSVLRGLIGAIDNAEAEGVSSVASSGWSSADIAGGRAGVGSTDVARRRLSSANLQQILLCEITDLTDQSAHYEAIGEYGQADRLQALANVASRYRSPAGGQPSTAAD